MRAKEVEALSNKIKPLLAGNSPEIQGAVIGEIAATFIAGHAPPLRQEQFDLLIKYIWDLVPECERENFPQGYPKHRQ